MVKNVLNIVGWLGTALVVGAVAVRILRPEWGSIRGLRRVGRPRVRGALHTRTMARDH
jgi:hypothetical protein